MMIVDYIQSALLQSEKAHSSANLIYGSQTAVISTEHIAIALIISQRDSYCNSKRSLSLYLACVHFCL